MKKKIKDLTITEWSEICMNHNCDDCPLWEITQKNCLVMPMSERELESEVEIDE